MLINYIKLSLRLLARNPFFTGINVLGLSVGFAVFFILWQHSQNELHSDQQWSNWQEIYRFGMIAKWTDDKTNWNKGYFGTNDALLTEQVANRYPEIEDFTRLLAQKNIGEKGPYAKDHGSEIFFTSIVNGTQKTFLESKVAYADANFLNFFNVPLLAGNRDDALALSGSVVLSERLSKKYFGTIQSVGNSLLLNDKVALQVSGVFKNLSNNTHFDFDALISSQSLKHEYSQLNNALNGPTSYFKLAKGVQPDTLAVEINLDMKGVIQDVTYGSYPFGRGEIYLQPLSEMVFTRYNQDFYTTKSKTMLLVMQYASIAILVLGWINYLNLTISSVRKRMKEISARKIVGAKDSDFLLQFCIEALIVNLISVLIALTMIQLVVVQMQYFLEIQLTGWRDLSIITISIFACALVVGTLLVGTYPILLFKRRPGYLTKSTKSLRTTTLFSAFEYGVTMAVLVFVFVIFSQLEFILKSDIGFNKEEVVVVDLPVNKNKDFSNRLKLFTDRLRETEVLTVSQSVPGDNRQEFINVYTADERTGLKLQCNGGVDTDFIGLYNIELLAGRNFSSSQASDSLSVLLSEGAMKRFGISSPEDIIGSNFVIGVRLKTVVRVIGVFKDYALKSLLKEGNSTFEGSPGLILTFNNPLSIETFNQPQRVSIKINPNTFDRTVTTARSEFEKFFPGQFFNWYFLNDAIDGKYHHQLIIRNQFLLFSIIAVGIAILGLLGMTTNTVVEKTKEIGIRKVLGAQLHQIAKLLLTTTTKQILVATAVGIPVAYYLIQGYLEKYSERIALQWWHFGVPVVTLVVIMFFSISSVLWKAAKNNPVDALKYE